MTLVPAADIEARVHSTLQGSRSNGPGLRNVVWFQGCTRGCPGCFNPETHPLSGGERVRVARLACLLLDGDPEGITLSGGEPMEQPEALLALLHEVRHRKPRLSLLLFTGNTLDQLRRQPLGESILDALDVVVAGPYVKALHQGKGILGSSNQEIHLQSARHKPPDFDAIPRAEVVLHRDGAMTLTGFPSIRFSGIRLRRDR